jgi:hypothetical protein
MHFVAQFQIHVFASIIVDSFQHVEAKKGNFGTVSST